jgi:hypothetical protein
VAFGWEGWSPAGPWGATGALTGNTLTIRYNDIMYLTDFEDAVYALASTRLGVELLGIGS